jgi:hypothetical protein
MSVYLLRAYGGFPASSTNPITFPDSTESALIAQGIAVAAGTTAMPAIYGGPDQFLTQGGNIASAPNAGVGTPTYYQGPLIWPCINLGSAALTGYETNGAAPVAGSMNLTEIQVPYWNTWTGIGVLNGTTVGTDNHLVALYGSNGALIANSAVAGTVSAGASVFQNRAFLFPVTLAPGRYFLGVQSNGTTATLRHLLAANGSNVCTSVTAGVFGTVPATMTPPATFTTAVGVIAQLYT